MWSENLKLGTSVARCFDMVSHVTRIPIVEFYTMLIEQKRNLTPNNGHPAAPARQSVVGSKNVTIHDNGVCMLHACDGCGKTALRMLLCSRCHAVFYCNKGCQRAHWKEHKPKCNAAKAVKGVAEVPISSPHEWMTGIPGIMESLQLAGKEMKRDGDLIPLVRVMSTPTNGGPSSRTATSRAPPTSTCCTRHIRVSNTLFASRTSNCHRTWRAWSC